MESCGAMWMQPGGCRRGGSVENDGVETLPVMWRRGRIYQRDGYNQMQKVRLRIHRDESVNKQIGSSRSVEQEG